MSAKSFFVPNRYSFRLVNRKRLIAESAAALESTEVPVAIEAHVLEAESAVGKTEKGATDEGKRLFLRLAGVAGLGVVAATVFPKTADAYVMGSAPTSAVVGVKDSSNARIDPATEDGNLATIAGKDFATQTTLALIKTNSDKFNFDGTDLKVVNTGGGGGGASEVGILNAANVQINPATDDSVILLRRMVKLMESQATVDVANRQRITVDAWGTSVSTGTGTSAGVPRVALGTDSTVGTVTSVTNVATIGSYAAQQMYGDVAHDVYANALRRHLIFS